MRYDYKAKKIVAVLSEKLEPGIALNVVGHLATSLGAHCPDPDLMGRSELLDALGTKHQGISKYPFIATKGKPSHVRRAIEEARQNPNLFVSAYPKQMLETGHDDELAAAIAQADEASLEYLGAIIYGPTAEVNVVGKRFSLWK